MFGTVEDNISIINAERYYTFIAEECSSLGGYHQGCRKEIQSATKLKWYPLKYWMAELYLSTIYWLLPTFLKEDSDRVKGQGGKSANTLKNMVGIGLG